MSRADLVQAALRSPAWTLELPATGWDLLLRQARAADLLGRIALLLARDGLLRRVPAAPAAHLHAAITLTAAQHLEIMREVTQLARALAPLNIQPVLLKGAAYLVGNTAAALGRTFDDVDLLVPKPRLPEVEAHLMMGGWVTTHLTPYDQRYYREWMHELPPMQHATRQSVVDVHHAILPMTAYTQPPSELLLRDAVPIPGEPAWRMLSAPDRVLHSMVHLFHNEELSHGLRDLSDIDLMLRAHSTESGFWPTLQDRAEELRVARTLHHALGQCQHQLDTPVPEKALQAANRHAGPAWQDRFMKRLWSNSLRSIHPTARSATAHLSDFTLFVRAHALRMPAGMLLRHLAHKAWRRQVTERATE